MGAGLATEELHINTTYAYIYIHTHTYKHYFGYKMKGVALNTIFPQTLLDVGQENNGPKQVSVPWESWDAARLGTL